MFRTEKKEQKYLLNCENWPCLSLKKLPSSPLSYCFTDSPVFSSSTRFVLPLVAVSPLFSLVHGGTVASSWFSIIE